MDTVFNLESFDAAGQTINRPSADYQAGFADGMLAGRAEAIAGADHLQRDVAHALCEITCTYQQAREDVMSSLAGLINELAQAVLPHCVTHGFAGQIAGLILHRFMTEGSDEIRVNVHPDQVAAVTAATKQLRDAIIVRADRSLTENAAWISQSTSEIHLNLDQHLADITTILSTINIEDIKDMDNG